MKKKTHVKGSENIFNMIIYENFFNLKEELKKIQETHRMQNRNSPQHRTTKTLSIQNEGKVLKSSREKDQITYKIKIMPEFSIEFLKAWRASSDLLKPLQDHRCQARLLCAANLSITINEEKKNYSKIKSNSSSFSLLIQSTEDACRKSKTWRG